MDDGPQMQFLGGQYGKTLRQIEAHLMTKHRQRAGAGAIRLGHPFIVNALHQLEVLLHVTFISVKCIRISCRQWGDRP